MKDKKIALISVYFGKYPDYFSIWLKSAEKNENIDFLLYGDCDVSTYEPLPKNVKAIFCTFEEMKSRIQSCFDFEISLNKPYKLCDYKPIYGYAFENDIQSYDYWGHVDIDTVLGNLYAFLPDEEYDKVYQFGHLTLYRNTPENNSRFMSKGGMDYKKVFTTDFNMIFDELPGMSRKFDILEIPQYKGAHFADIARRRLSFTLNDEITRKNYKKQIFYYDNGRVFRDYFDEGELKTDEFNYIHFSHRNMPDKTNGSNSFYITRFGFVDKTGETTADIINELNAPTPIKDISCEFNTQVIRRIKRYSKLAYLKIKEQ